jgi:uncharacterized protein YndB with AHSA1/START domain
MPSIFTVSAVIPASPRDIYDAWLDGKSHAKMIGGPAKGSAREGAAFSAWDGYITGKNRKLVPGERIVQSWRTTRFTPADPDSEIEITLAKAPRGTKVTLRHSKVPDGHDGYRSGWKTHYFEPMKAYFAERAKPKAAQKPAKST